MILLVTSPEDCLGELLGVEDFLWGVRVQACRRLA